MVELSNVTVEIDGKVVSSPRVISKRDRNYIFGVVIEVKRTSGVIDSLNLNYPSNIVVSLKEGDFVHAVGDIRTNTSNTTYILASDVQILEKEPEDYTNNVEMSNVELASIGELRMFGNKPVIAVEFDSLRKHGRHSIIGANIWGTDAVFISNTGKVGNKYSIKGRLQKHTSKYGKTYTEVAIFYIEDLKKHLQGGSSDEES